MMDISIMGLYMRVVNLHGVCNYQIMRMVEDSNEIMGYNTLAILIIQN